MMSQEQNQKKKKVFKYWNLELDGPDKTGKSTLAQYITQLSNYRFATHDRGYMTQVVYNKKFGRNFEYSKPSKDTIYILLTTCAKEHDIRCKITNEPKINFEEDMQMFLDVYESLAKDGYKCLFYNTSLSSFYDIANDIIKHIDKFEEESK